MLTKKESSTLIGISLMTFIVFLDVTIVSTALPAIQREFVANLDALQWVLNALFLALSALMITTGRIGDLLGRRRILYFSAFTFLIASIGAGLAQSINALIFFRLLQGIAGASIPVAAALLANHFPTERQPHILALFATINGSGLALGPLVGGLLVEMLSWRWIFLINIPVILTSLALCAYSVKEQKTNDSDEKFNISAALAMILGISAFVIALTQGPSWGWQSDWVIGLFALAAIALVTFVVINHKAQHPVIDFEIFRNRYVVCAALSCFCIGGIISALLFLNPLYLQSIRGQSAEYSGMVLLAISGTFMLVSLFTGKLIHRFGVKMGLYVMLMLCVLTSVLHHQFSLTTPLLFIIITFISFGIPWSLANVAPTLAAVSSIDKKHSAVALGGIWTIWNLGSCIALAISGWLMHVGGEAVLTNALAKEHIVMSAEQFKSVSHLISDPEHAKHLLSQFSGVAEDVVAPVLKEAFMQGFHLTLQFLIALSVAVMLIVYFTLRKAPDVQVAENQTAEF